MMDLIFLTIVAVFFAVATAYVFACEHLRQEKTGAKYE